MREPAATDFKIPLPDVGDFVYARRTIGDMMKIRVRYLKYLDGIAEEDDKILSFFAGIVAANETLLVSCPVGWEDLTVLDDALRYEKIVELSTLLTNKEDSFRVAAKVASKE
jgi:hypothetical protein